MGRSRQKKSCSTELMERIDIGWRQAADQSAEVYWMGARELRFAGRWLPDRRIGA